MKKLKKVALVFFPINDVGGIITWIQEIQKGLRNNGVEPVLFYATASKRFAVDPDKDVVKGRYTQLAGFHLSYDDEFIEDSIDTLNMFDAVIFTKISPHPTKQNLAYSGIENWSRLYSDIKKRIPKVVVFHDAMWKKTNSWSKKVAKYVDICMAAQKKFYQGALDYPADCIKYYDVNPMDLKNNGDIVKKRDYVGMVSTQWTGWKNHAKFLPLLSDVEVQIDFYGNGIAWHYLNKKKDYLNNIAEDYEMTKEGQPLIVHNKKAINRMMGYVPYETLKVAYSRNLFSIDLSTRGYNNYTHTEPLAFGCISLVEQRVAEDPDTYIPQDCFLPYDLDAADQYINEYFSVNNSKLIKKTREKGLLFIQNSNCDLVAQRLIQKIELLLR